MPDQSDPRAGEPVKKKSILRFIFKVMLLGVVLLVMAGGVGYWLLKTEPAYVKEAEAFLETTPPVQLRQMAESLEKRITDELTRISPRQLAAVGGVSSTDGGSPADASQAPSQIGEERVIAVSLKELNAWMNTRMEDWLASQDKSLPEEVTKPTLAIVDQQLVLSLRCVSDRINQLVSITFEVVLPQEGKATLKLIGIQGGKLPLPAGTASKILASTSGSGMVDEDAVGKIAEAFDGMSFRPIHEYAKDDPRQARAVGLSLRDDGIDVTVRIEPNKRSRKGGQRKSSE